MLAFSDRVKLLGIEPKEVTSTRNSSLKERPAARASRQIVGSVPSFSPRFLARAGAAGFGGALARRSDHPPRGKRGPDLPPTPRRLQPRNAPADLGGRHARRRAMPRSWASGLSGASSFVRGLLRFSRGSSSSSRHSSSSSSSSSRRSHRRRSSRRRRCCCRRSLRRSSTRGGTGNPPS